jgi:sulfur-oxidizing protein SoxZ
MTARILLPPNPKVGVKMDIRILIQHPMETGFRHDISGAAITKNVIHHFSFDLDGITLFSGELGTGTSANPFLQFSVILPHSGWLELKWVDDEGNTGTERVLCNLST